MPACLETLDLVIAFPGPDGGRRRVVDGVHVRVSEGECVAVVGESGSGKSLTALAALGLLPAPGRVEAGVVRLAGVDVCASTEATLRGLRGRAAGLVQQDPAAAFNPVRRLWPQVTEAACLQSGAHGRGNRLELALRLLAEVGIEAPLEMARAFPHQLSGGQRQRAAVAAALAGDPGLLIADEVTSALDTVSQNALLHLLARLQRERRMAMMLITHDLGLAGRFAGRVVVLHAGETVESGPVGEVGSAPAHPYTQALLAGTAPPPGAATGASLQRSRCRFAGRCPRAMPRCLEARPAVVQQARERTVRCFLWSDTVEPRDA